MISTFRLAGRCTACDTPVEGLQVSNVRVNLHSLRTQGVSVAAFKRHPGCPDLHAPVADVTYRLDEVSAAKVEARRAVLLQRAAERKRRAS